ncbi:MAG: cell division protein SepF [Hominimerdicola sp.]
MGILTGLKNMFVGEDEIEIEEEYPVAYESRETSKNSAAETTTETVDKKENANRGINMENGQSLQIVLTKPSKFSEVKDIGGDINEQKTVLLNLESVKSEDARRILDFISGVAYANNATIKMTAQKTYIIMPSNVTFTGEDLLGELESNGYNF